MSSQSQEAKSRAFPRILVIATQGAGGSDEARILTLLAPFEPVVFPFDYQNKKRSFFKLLRKISEERPDLVVLEGTGIGGGAAVVLGRVLNGIPYVVSSGDAVGPFVSTQSMIFGPVFGIYERLLCKLSAGFIGWTPYLAGRALTFGAPKTMTAAGWAPYVKSHEDLQRARQTIRSRHGILESETVIGIAGSLAWTERVGYCYGYELVQALRQVQRKDLRVLIVGDGNGRPRLEALAAALGPDKVVFTGHVPKELVPDYLAAMDLASLPQSTDQVGSFRYTTKISEYLSCGLPVVTSQIPLAYDLGGDWIWRLPGQGPWMPEYINALAGLLDQITKEELSKKRKAAREVFLWEFDRDTQINRVGAFVTDLLRRSPE